MPDAPKQRSNIALLFVLFMGVLMAALDIAIVGPALPAIAESFGVSERGISWVFNVFVLFNLVSLPLMAKLSDVFGRRGIYILDVLLFGAGSFLVAVSPSFGMLLVGRAVQGVATAGIFPVASAVIGDTFPPDRRGRALGILGAVFGLAFIIGPILAGILLQVSWHWLFYVNVALAAMVALAAFRVLPARHTGESRRLDWGGIVTLGVMLAALAYGVNQIDSEALGSSLASLEVWPFIVLAGLLVPVFIRIERRAEDPLLRLGLMRSKQVVLAGLLAGGAGLTEAAFIFFPALAVAAYGVTKSTASFMLLPLVFAFAFGSPLGGRVLDRVGSRTMVLAGSASMTLGMTVLGVFPAYEEAFYIGSVLIGLGLAVLLGSAISYILLNESRVEERTVAQGISTLFISVGRLLGAALIGALAASGVDPVGGYARAFLAIAAVGLVLTFLTLGLKKRTAERATRMMES